MSRAFPPRVGVILAAATAVMAGLGLAVAFRGPRLALPPVAALPAAADPAVALAIEAAEEAVRRAPDSASAWGELALVLVANGEDDAAVACFREAATRDTRSWRWPSFAATILGRRDPQAALADVDAAIERDPLAVWPRLRRAEWRAALGRPEARADFDAVLAAEPGHARARLGLARLLVAGDSAREALEILAPARDHPSTRRSARELAASVAARRGDTAAAAALLAEAAGLPPDAPWADDPLDAELPQHVHGKRGLIALVERMERDGSIDRAGALTRRLETEHRDVWLFVEGRLRAGRGDLPAAERAFREALSLDPGAVEVHTALAGVLAEEGKVEEAAQALRDLLRLEPAHGPAWLALGRLLLPNDRPAARAALRSAAAYMPASEEARKELSAAEAGDAVESDDR